MLIIIAATPLFALEDFVKERLILAWRTHLTESLLAGFFADAAYYRVVHLGQVDNPDQRITQDVAAFVRSSTEVVSLIFSKVLNCAAFAGVRLICVCCCCTALVNKKRLATFAGSCPVPLFDLALATSTGDFWLLRTISEMLLVHKCASMNLNVSLQACSGACHQPLCMCSWSTLLSEHG